MSTVRASNPWCDVNISWYCTRQTDKLTLCQTHHFSEVCNGHRRRSCFCCLETLGFLLLCYVSRSHHIMNDDTEIQHMHACKHYSSLSYRMSSSIILSSFYWSPSSPPRVTCSSRRSDLRIGARHSESQCIGVKSSEYQRIGVKSSESQWKCDHLCGTSYNSTFVCEVVGSHQFAVGPFHRQPCCIASIVACRVRRLLNGVNIEPLYLEYWTWGCWCLSFMYRWIRGRGSLD